PSLISHLHSISETRFTIWFTFPPLSSFLLLSLLLPPLLPQWPRNLRPTASTPAPGKTRTTTLTRAPKRTRAPTMRRVPIFYSRISTSSRASAFSRQGVILASSASSLSNPIR
ncbi:hypothetical protein BKA70DRAFT_1528417, partial [Coprinopsis sp. MPI-PUGE-AT-0042]